MYFENIKRKNSIIDNLDLFKKIFLEISKEIFS